MPTDLLAVDVGNSRLKLGWFTAEPSPTGRLWPTCREFLARPLAESIPWDLVRSWLPGPLPPLVIAGSHPQVMEDVAASWERETGQPATLLRDRAWLPLQMTVEYPERVGIDRLLNAVAANVLRPTDRAAIVVDSGTATTVNWIDANGAFAGGSILPGLALSAQALHHYTALLPLLTLGDLGPDVPPALGRNTREALRSGIYWGQVGAIRTLIDQLHAERNDTSEPPPWLILTGGGAVWLSRQFPTAPVIPSLALHGLVLTIWSRESAS